MIKRKVLISAIALLAATTAFSNPAAKPEACPSIAAIKAGRLTDVDSYSDMYIAYTLSSYSTSNEWVFMILPLWNKSKLEALNAANILLPSLSGNPIPVYEGGKDWRCDYHLSDPDIQAIAMTGSDFRKVLNKVR